LYTQCRWCFTTQNTLPSYGLGLEDGSERGSPSTSGAGCAVDAAATAEDELKRSAKVNVEDGVEERIQRRVGVAEPEEERAERPWDRTDGRRTPAGDDVEDEEAEPHAAEAGDDNGHAHGRSHLALLAEEPTEARPAAERQHGRDGRPSRRALGLAPRKGHRAPVAGRPRRHRQKRRRR